MDLEMEEWQQTFQELIQEEKPCHRWTLTLDRNLTPNRLQPDWKQYQQWVFARFQCSWCSRRWASAHVQVLFHMRWNRRKSKGQVKMRVFAQKCQKCSEPSFEVPEFTEENISRILDNLVSKILDECYGEGSSSMEEIPTIKYCRLKGAHDSDNCEACLQGFCTRSELDLAAQSRTSPSSSSVSEDGVISSYEPSPTRGSTVEDSETGNTQRKKGEALHRSWFSEPTRVPSPRANTTYQEQNIIQISTLDEDLYSRVARNPVHSNVCCYVVIVILIVCVLIVVNLAP